VAGIDEKLYRIDEAAIVARRNTTALAIAGKHRALSHGI
jgi:hypothetical protein